MQWCVIPALTPRQGTSTSQEQQNSSPPIPPAPTPPPRETGGSADRVRCRGCGLCAGSSPWGSFSLSAFVAVSAGVTGTSEGGDPGGIPACPALCPRRRLRNKGQTLEGLGRREVGIGSEDVGVSFILETQVPPGGPRDVLLTRPWT